MIWNLGSSPTRDELIRALKAGADYIRGGVDYKVLLLFLFYKVLSDKWLKAVEDYKKEGYTQTKAYLLANETHYILFDEEEQKLLTWHEVMKKRETIIDLVNALIRISKLNPTLSDLQKLIEVLGLKSFVNSENVHNIQKISEIFNTFNFSEISYDVLGDAYMWILNYFAPEKAKEGENYTPQEVVKLLVRLLDIENGSKILDPALGSASMLIESWNYVAKKEKPDLKLFGQERNDLMGIIAKMNLILHGIKDYEIFIGDSLSNPRFGECDYVLANPPWNQDYNVEALRDPKVKRIYTTFARDGFPPSSSMDWAWIQLMLFFAKKKVGIILDNGALFRGGREKKIREEIVKKDLLEAVILLPEKLFYNTGAPGCIMVFNKRKVEERRGKVIFINASNEFEKHSEIKRLNQLGEKNIERIVNAYREFKDAEGFSKVVSLEEIAKNDFNLNVTLYVFPLEKSEEIDVFKEFEELKALEMERAEIMTKLEGYIQQIKEVTK
ncbi:MAG: class I SAM-dependent DNA methyltransferase [Archaeoglobaceae archaeon]